jgi:hypothetical protein
VDWTGLAVIPLGAGGAAMTARYVAVRQMRRRDYSGRWFSVVVNTSMFEAMTPVFAAYLAPPPWEAPLVFLVILLLLMLVQAAWIIPLSLLLPSRPGNRGGC